MEISTIFKPLKFCFYRFVPIQQRPYIRVVISEKFVEIFNWYEGDLDEIQVLYEKHKVSSLYQKHLESSHIIVIGKNQKKLHL